MEQVLGLILKRLQQHKLKKHFITKMSIASKEPRETRYWLKLLDKSKLVEIAYTPYLNSIEHIINIVTKIVKTS